tara:strand:+ start:49 stop:240 length:192 start_codon:yes stop_codon:yes gene_type:complete
MGRPAINVNRSVEYAIARIRVSFVRREFDAYFQNRYGSMGCEVLSGGYPELTQAGATAITAET